MAELRWYEWLDREAHPELKEAVLEALAQGVDAVRRIREERPRGEARSWEAAAWWADRRHLLLLALMGREGTISTLAAHMGMSVRMIYSLLEDWRLHYATFPLRAVAEAPSGELHDATILWNGERYVARVNGVEVPARWAYGWYLAGDPVRAYPVRIALEAARLAGYRYHKTPLAWELSVLSREMGFVPSPDRIPHPVLVLAFGEEAVREALRRVDPCGCVMWDVERGCLLEAGRTGPCEDRIPE